MLLKVYTASQPFFKISGTFASIAGAAEKLKIARVIGTTSHSSDDMIDLKFPFSFARRATTLLFFIDCKHVFLCMFTAIFSFLRATILIVHGAVKSPTIYVSRFPRLQSGSYFFGVLLRPTFYLGAMTGRILSTARACPSCFQTGTHLMPSLAPQSGAFYALAGRSSTGAGVTVLTWLDRLVGFGSRFHSGSSFGFTGRHGSSDFVNYSYVAACC